MLQKMNRQRFLFGRISKSNLLSSRMATGVRSSLFTTETTLSPSLPSSDSTMKKEKHFRYLSAWFCPFAHRATLALEHHANSVSYDWIEALGWEKKFETKQHSDISNSNVNTNDNTVDQEEGESVWWYHWKSEELKRCNPSALVPTLIPVDTTSGQSLEHKAVYESLVTIDYIDQVSGATGIHKLVPDDPYWAATCRIWTDKLNKECCSPYYGILVPKSHTEREANLQTLIKGLQSFSTQLLKNNGNDINNIKTFLPNGQLSNVDLTLIPWSYRYYVLPHYRGEKYDLSKDKYPELEPYFRWFDHVMNLDSVKRTLPDKEKYLIHIEKYADSSARSKVANAVRRGVAAHELDDEKDEY